MKPEKLWNKGGYGANNDYAATIERINQHGREKELSQDDVDIILLDFFSEITLAPQKYMKPILEKKAWNEKTQKTIIIKYRECICGCSISNSGTNAIHTIFKRIEAKRIILLENRASAASTRFNKRIKTYIKNQKEITFFPEIVIFVNFILLAIIIRYFYGS